MKAFNANPAMHRNFEVSKRLRTAKTAVPIGLMEDEFENWLWRTN
jgi:hypothetical protein